MKGDVAQTYRKNVETDWRREERRASADYGRNNPIATGPAPPPVDTQAAKDRTGEMQGLMQWASDGSSAYDRRWRHGEGRVDPFGPAHGSPQPARQGGKARVEGRRDLAGDEARGAMQQVGRGPDYNRSDTIQAGPSPPLQRQGKLKAPDGAVGSSLQWKASEQTWRHLEMQRASEPSIQAVAGVSSRFDRERGDRMDRGGYMRQDGNRHHCTDTTTLSPGDQYARTSIAAQAAAHVERAQPIHQHDSMTDRLKWVAAAPASARSANARLPGGLAHCGGRCMNAQAGPQPGALNDMISWGGDSAQARAARARAAANMLPSGRRRLQQQKRGNFIPGAGRQRGGAIGTTRPTPALR